MKLKDLISYIDETRQWAIMNESYEEIDRFAEEDKSGIEKYLDRYVDWITCLCDNEGTMAIVLVDEKKDYKNLNLWAVDIGDAPLNDRDLSMQIELNLHRQHAYDNKMTVFVGTAYSVETFTKDYKKRHKKYADRIGKPFPLM